MPGHWQNISLEREDDFRALRSRVFRIMQGVYRQHDPIHQPQGIDTWWNSPSLSYQLDEGASEPSIIILNLREGRPDHPAMDTHFMINLYTMGIHDKFKNARFPVPPEITDDLLYLKNQTISHVRNQKPAQDQRSRALKYQEDAARKVFLQAQVDYYHRLSTLCLVDSKTIDTSAQDGCILCGNQQLYTCTGCHIVSCAGSFTECLCARHEMDGVERCVVHPTAIYCRSCRDISGRTPVLTQCPGCDDWHCRLDQSWCFGRSKDSCSPADNPSSVKSEPRHHMPMHELCKSCIDDTHLSPFMVCGNDGCWSKGSKVCEKCTPEGGMQCSEKHKWYCDSCATRNDFVAIWPCPGCNKQFCAECRGMDRCFGCGKSDLCKSCFKPEDYADTDPTLRWACEMCDGRLCESCVGKGLGVDCGSCRKSFCEDCASVDSCVQCDTIMCIACQKESCRACGGFSTSAIEEMAYEMYDEF